MVHVSSRLVPGDFILKFAEPFKLLYHFKFGDLFLHNSWMELTSVNPKPPNEVRCP